MRAVATMTRHVLTAAPQIPVAFAWSVMQDRRIRHLPVRFEGRLIGILSDRDVLKFATVNDDGSVEVSPDLNIRDVMTPAPLTCGRDAQVSWLAEQMVELKIDAVPVVHEGELVGLVTSTDLLALLCERPADNVLPFDFRLSSMRDREDTAAVA